MKTTRGHENGQILNFGRWDEKYLPSIKGFFIFVISPEGVGRFHSRRSASTSVDAQNCWLVYPTSGWRWSYNWWRGSAASIGWDFIGPRWPSKCLPQQKQWDWAGGKKSGWLKRIKYILEWAGIECALKNNLLHWKTGISLLKLLMESLKVWKLFPGFLDYPVSSSIIFPSG